MRRLPQAAMMDVLLANNQVSSEMVIGVAEIIEEYMLEYIDGVECWHSRHDAKTTAHYIKFARKHGLIITEGSDCHQKPILMGTMDIPDYVAEQFRR